MAALPPTVDLRAECPKIVYDQGELGSCTANAIAGGLEFDRIKEGLSDFIPSRLFIYYNERVMEGSVGTDSGAQICDGIKSVGSIGAPPETDWPYNIAEFAVKPPPKAYKDAPLDRAVQYQRVTQVLAQMKGCLASGYPFVYGFTVYQSFESPQLASTGIVSMPASGEKMLGATRCLPWDMTTARSASWCGIRGVPAGVWEGISRCRMGI
jgi:C1A family cysteine protease